MHDTSSKNAQVSPITTSFPWRHTNTCMNHGYNAVADDYRQVSSATTSFPWRHTNTCKNHGYNTVANDSGQVSFATTSFPWRDPNTCKNHGYNAVVDDSGQVSSATKWRHTNTRKNHGYKAVAEVSSVGSHVVPRILHSLPTKKVKKVEKGQTFSDHTYPTVSSRRRGRCVQSLVQIGSEMWICIRYKQTNKNEQKTISALYIRLFWLSISWSNCDTLQLQIYVFRDVTLCRWGRSACRFEYRCAFTFKMTELYVLLRRSVWYCYYCRHDSLLASRLKISPAQN